MMSLPIKLCLIDLSGESRLCRRRLMVYAVHVECTLSSLISTSIIEIIRMGFTAMYKKYPKFKLTYCIFSRR